MCDNNALCGARATSNIAAPNPQIQQVTSMTAATAKASERFQLSLTPVRRPGPSVCGWRLGSSCLQRGRMRAPRTRGYKLFCRCTCGIAPCDKHDTVTITQVPTPTCADITNLAVWLATGSTEGQTP